LRPALAPLLLVVALVLAACDMSSIEPPPLPWESGQARQQQPGWIGANLGAPSRYLQERYGMPEQLGAAVLYVLPKSPAARAKLQPGDLVTKINDIEISSPNDLVAVVLRAQGVRLRLTVLRPNPNAPAGQPVEKTLTVAVGKRPQKLEEQLVESFDKELRSQPDDAVLYYLRASMMEALGRDDAATEDYGKAIERAPRFGLAYSSRARLRLQSLMQTAGLPVLRPRQPAASPSIAPGDLEAIFSDAERAVSLDPDASWGYSVRAEAHLRQAQERANAGLISSDLERAILDASNALAAEPSLGRARLVRAMAYYAVGHLPEAQADLSLVLRISADQATRDLALEFLRQVASGS
jgi:tetratricopeptide (TPR) repeat protein